MVEMANLRGYDGPGGLRWHLQNDNDYGTAESDRCGSASPLLRQPSEASTSVTVSPAQCDRDATRIGSIMPCAAYPLDVPLAEGHATVVMPTIGDPLAGHLTSNRRLQLANEPPTLRWAMMHNGRREPELESDQHLFTAQGDGSSAAGPTSTGAGSSHGVTATVMPWHKEEPTEGSGGGHAARLGASEPLSLESRLRSAVAESKMKAERQRVEGRVKLPLGGTILAGGSATTHLQAQLPQAGWGAAVCGSDAPPGSTTTTSSTSTGSKRERGSAPCGDDGRVFREAPEGLGAGEGLGATLGAKLQQCAEQARQQQQQQHVEPKGPPQLCFASRNQLQGGVGSSTSSCSRSSSSSKRASERGNCSSSGTGSDACGHVAGSASSPSPHLLPELAAAGLQAPNHIEGGALSVSVGQRKVQQPEPLQATPAGSTAVARGNHDGQSWSPPSPADVICRIVAGHQTRLATHTLAEQRVPFAGRGAESEAGAVAGTTGVGGRSGNRQCIPAGGNQHPEPAPLADRVRDHPASPLPAPLLSAMAQRMLSRDQAEGIAQMLAEFSGGDGGGSLPGAGRELGSEHVGPSAMQAEPARATDGAGEPEMWGAASTASGTWAGGRRDPQRAAVQQLASLMNRNFDLRR